MNIHGLDPVLQWNQPFDLRAATPTGQRYAGILLKSSLSPCSLCQGSFTLSIGGQDLGQAPAGQCTWYIMRQDITQWPHQDAGIWQSLPQSRMVQLVFWKLKIFLNLALSARGTSCGNFRKQPALAVLFAARAACASFETDNAERYHANKSWPALSLPLPLSLSQLQPFRIHSNSTHIYWNAAIRQNCRSSTAALESATNCFHLLSSESQALKQRVWSENHPPVAPLQWLDESKAL